jgi:hypothetical protein
MGEVQEGSEEGGRVGSRRSFRVLNFYVFQTLRHSALQFLAQFNVFPEHELQIFQRHCLADLALVFAGQFSHVNYVRQWVVLVHRVLVTMQSEVCNNCNESDVTSVLTFNGGL